MTRKKTADPTAPQLGLTTPRERKPWKKRTPVERMLDQIDRLEEEVAQREEDLKTAKRQLQKLQEIRKTLEST
jgi:hypothetical protein